MDPEGSVQRGVASVPQTGETKASDTCNHCGLRRATKALEEHGTEIRLCDDCYWGQESQPAVTTDAPPAR